MKVFVFASITGHNDLSFRFATTKHPASEIYTLERKGQYLNGNPYGVYGKLIGEKLGVKDYLSLDISVYECVSAGDGFGGLLEKPTPKGT